MVNLQDLYYQKAQKQRREIGRLLQEGTSAIIEMPEHEVIFDINIKWLRAHKIGVETVRDRDGRPICLIDTSKILELEQRYEDRYTDQPLFEDENIR